MVASATARRYTRTPRDGYSSHVATRMVAGRYVLGERLGAGGVGEVWGATDTTTGAEVAVKLLLDLHMDNAEVRERFLREGRLLARIDSPHVCRVLGSGADGD